MLESRLNMQLPLTPFQETLHKGMCGPASLKIVLAYFDIEKTEAELAQLVGVTDSGSTAEGIVSAAKALGLSAKAINESSFEDIQEWLERQVPVIVNWFTRGRSDYSDSEVADGHYSVVAGLNETHIYLQDPEIGSLRTLARDDFMRVWFDFEGDTIRPDELIVRQIIVIQPVA
ncbi:hypothetical protein BH11PAT2_BH11PAT2_04550 [soil metagenome]